MNQHEAVVNATYNICGESTEKYNPTKADRDQIIDQVTEDILEGVCDLSDVARAKYNTPKLVRGYVAGMVSNWLRKSLHLNGGVPYEIQNPGSRAGGKDDLIKNLKLVIKSGKLTPDQQKIAEASIAERLAEIKAMKAPTVEPDLSVIPADLLESLGLTE